LRHALPLLALAALWPGGLGAGPSLLHLKIGDPARKSQEAPVVLGGITDTAGGELLAPAALADRLADTGILFVGENHGDAGFHAVQLEVIRMLHAAGRQVLVGVEMLPYTAQPALDCWNEGRCTEPEFLAQADWYRHWGYHWNYYRDIFRFARAQRIPVYALNSPREVIRAVRAGGLAALEPGPAARFPPRLAPASAEHEALYRAAFAADDPQHMGPAALEGLYRAQAAWDATLGWNALAALAQHGGSGAILVVLLGAGHATYGLGAERQVAPYARRPMASLVPVPVEDRQGRPVTRVSAAYANFLWGVPPPTTPLYPDLGISLMGTLGAEPAEIIRVQKGSVAARAGFAVGDVLRGLDGQPVRSERDLRLVVAGYRWGDRAVAQVRRGGRDLTLNVVFSPAAP